MAAYHVTTLSCDGCGAILPGHHETVRLARRWARTEAGWSHACDASKRATRRDWCRGCTAARAAEDSSNANGQL